MTWTSPISSSSSTERARPELVERLQAVRGGIADAARLAGRDASAITTVVVTKFHPVGLIEELFTLGVRDFGESRHQEAQSKAAELAGLRLNWHFVGQIQSKKARQVRAYARVVHSVDRPGLVDALASDEIVLDCFIQVNLTSDPGRGGAQPSELLPLVDRVQAAPGLRLLGLMAVAPLQTGDSDADPRRAFARVRELSASIQHSAPEATALSMGMSQDYAAAILEGATHLRIGTAITGKRPEHH